MNNSPVPKTKLFDPLNPPVSKTKLSISMDSPVSVDPIFSPVLRTKFSTVPLDSSVSNSPMFSPLSKTKLYIAPIDSHVSKTELSTPVDSHVSSTEQSLSPVSKTKLFSAAPMHSHVSKTRPSDPPPLSAVSSSISSGSSICSSSCSETDESPVSSRRFFELQHVNYKLPIPCTPNSGFQSHRSLAVLSGHVGSVSCLALCGEFILSASQGKDIIVWQQPDLRLFAKFGQGEGSVKALATAGNKVFTAHQDSRIRVWKVSRSSENMFKLVDTLPTTKDYLGKFMKQSNYIQTRRHHKKLWIEHADSISCLTVHDGLIYSGSWDKTLKVWRLSDLKCLESIKAHDDAINGLVACKGIVYSASADGKIKAWEKEGKIKSKNSQHCSKGVLEGHKDVSFNSVVVSDDGKWVYGGGSDGFIMGWEVMNNNFEGYCWKLVSQVKAHEMAVLCMCLMGEFLCSGSADKSIGIWKREAFGKICKVGVITGHEGPVKCLQASSNLNRIGDGFLLYSGSLDRSVRVWWVPKYNDDDDNSATLIKLNHHHQKSIVSSC